MIFRDEGPKCRFDVDYMSRRFSLEHALANHEGISFVLKTLFEKESDEHTLLPIQLAKV